MRPAAALLFAFSLTSCTEVPATQTVVFLHAEPGLVGMATTLRVTVTAGGAAVVMRDDPLAPEGTQLARIPLVPRDGDASRTFTVLGELVDAGGAVVAEIRVGGGYVEDELREIRAWFDASCAAACGEGSTCVDGRCVGACFDGHAEEDEIVRSRPTCDECFRCADGACVPAAAGTPCGCPGETCGDGGCEVMVPVRDVVTSRFHTCATTESNGLYCWGDNHAFRASFMSDELSPRRVESIGGTASLALGTDHTCHVGFDQRRQCWGWTGGGATGVIAADASGRVPGMPLADPTAPPGPEPEWQNLTAGWGHTCGLAEDNRIYCWGGDSRGQTTGAAGTTPEDQVDLPRMALEGEWAQVEGGALHTCARDADGRIFCWGANQTAQLGNGNTADSTEPACVTDESGACLDGFTQLSAGHFANCALRDAGRVWCWGGNGGPDVGDDRLGTGSVEPDVLRPAPLVSTQSFDRVVAGAGHACALDDGELWCWGENGAGQLGLGDTNLRNTPTRVELTPGDRWLRVSPGSTYTCAVREDRSLWCWGAPIVGYSGAGGDQFGRLGLGDVTTDVLRPRRVCF